MIEIIIVLAAAVLGFGVFLLVFLIKGKSEEGPIKIHTCADCDCHRNGRQHQRGIEFWKERNRESSQ